MKKESKNKAEINRKHTVFRKRLRKIALVAVSAALLISFTLAVIYNGGFFTEILPRDGVSFVCLSVGQANCTVIFTEEETVVIDTGSTASAENVDAAFAYYGVETIDYVILTHADEDHTGGLHTILNHYTVLNVLLTVGTYEALSLLGSGRTLNTALENGIVALVTVTAGDRFLLDSASFEFLTPSVTDPSIQYGDNAAGLVILFEHGDTTAIFSGDADETGEMKALKVLLDTRPDFECDLLMVGHHGSNTSSTEGFVNFLKPRYAVISCGLHNMYGHPHESVVQRLTALGATVFRTDRAGTVLFHSDGTTLEPLENTIGFAS